MTVQTKDYSLLYFVLLLCFVVVTAKLTAQHTVILTVDTKNKADQLLEKNIAEQVFTGVIAGISINGNKEWMQAKGYSNAKAKDAMTIQTITRTASIAKSMTAVAVMQLFEQGLIDLDAPIQTYIPDFPKKTAGDITTRQLLYQTSGIAGYASAKEAQTTKNYESLAAAVEVFKNRDLLHQPGSAFYYSTYNYVTLGLIIEKVSGLTYEAYMTKNILEKAGMTNTGVEKYQSQYANKSSLYHRNKKGKIKLVSKENNLSNRIPGGGFYSCLEDMLRFGEAIINHELISEKTFQMMVQKSTVEKEGNPYGLGWFMYGGKENPSDCIGHSGEQTGVSAQLMILPAKNMVVAVMSNTSGSWEKAIHLSVQLIQLAKEEKEMGE